MRQAVLVVGILVAGAGLVVGGAPLFQQPSVVAATGEAVPQRQLGASFAELDPILTDVASHLHSRVVKNTRGLPERSISWVASDGTALTMSIRVKSIQGKPKLVTALEAQRDFPEMGQSFNLQYLGLQQQMQDENRRFTLISNIMKNKHDTAKNSISNVR
jgi:hypothetical protein